MCFFQVHCNPSPAGRRGTRICKRSEWTVTLIGWSFFVQPIAAQCWRRRGRQIMKINKINENTIFDEIPVLQFSVENCWRHLAGDYCMNFHSNRQENFGISVIISWFDCSLAYLNLVMNYVCYSSLITSLTGCRSAVAVKWISVEWSDFL